MLCGESQTTEVTVRIPGGVMRREVDNRIANITEIWSDSPILEIGENYLLFLFIDNFGGAFYTGDNVYRVTGMSQGIFGTRDENYYIPQFEFGERLLRDELTRTIELIKDIPIDYDYFKNQFIENLKRNLANGMISQEQYDLAMENMNVRAVKVMSIED